MANKLDLHSNYFLPENRKIQFGYLPEFIGGSAHVQTKDHSEILFIYNNSMTTITLGFNPESANVFFMDGPADGDTVSIQIVQVMVTGFGGVTGNTPGVELQWNVANVNGREIQYNIVEVVT